jgi:hypothetical protein
MCNRIQADNIADMSDYKKAVARMMSEEELQKNVADLARMLGWLVRHTPKVQTADGSYRTTEQYDGVGFPDLFMAKEGVGLMLIELKSEKGTLSEDQEKWRRHIGDINSLSSDYRYYIWRPSDWANGLVEECLRGGW